EAISSPHGATISRMKCRANRAGAVALRSPDGAQRNPGAAYQYGNAAPGLRCAPSGLHVGPARASGASDVRLSCATTIQPQTRSPAAQSLHHSEERSMLKIASPDHFNRVALITAAVLGVLSATSIHATAETPAAGKIPALAGNGLGWISAGGFLDPPP